MSPGLLAALALGAAVGLALLAAVVARPRRPDGDLGDIWARALSFTGFALGLPVLISGFVKAYEPWWLTGRHAHIDLIYEKYFIYALLVPVGLWGAALLALALMRPAPREAVRGLAGTVGLGGGRAWVLFAALPAAVLLAWTWRDLGGGQNAFPAAVFSTLLVVGVTLVGLALSRASQMEPARSAAATQPLPENPEVPRDPWPEAMHARGFDLSTLGTWPASSQRPLASEAATPSAQRERADQQLRRSLPDKLERVVKTLLDPGMPRPCSFLVMGPDDAGQLEAVAALALTVARRERETVLVVVPRKARQLADTLGPCVGPDLPIWLGEAGRPLSLDKPLWVVNAELLSERLIGEMASRRRAASVGLVVWWDLQEYSGVLAANMWAISRRLHRVIARGGRPDFRTLALARSTSHAHDQLPSFIARLLPCSFPDGHIVTLEAQACRSIELHSLDSHRRFMQGPEVRSGRVNAKHAHPPLALALASVEARWATALELSQSIPSEARASLLGLTHDGRPIAEHLVPTPSRAGARILSCEGGDVLSLYERICQGGRERPPGQPHHVAVPPPDNPYAAWLLQQVRKRPGQVPAFPASRRLVVPNSSPPIIRRHLLKALAEHPDTRERLVRSFHNEVEVKKTLDLLARDNRLEQTGVRWLDADGQKREDQFYKSALQAPRLPMSLDIMGMQVLEVCDYEGSGEHRGSVRMRLDPERLGIQAYPGQVFFSDGQRYRVENWGARDAEAIRLGNRSLRCEKEAAICQTYRIRRAQILDAEPQPGTHHLDRGGQNVSQHIVELEYQETVSGRHQVSWDLLNNESKFETATCDPIRAAFRTRGLLLNFPFEFGAIPIASLCEALRILLPVHLHVEPDAVELLPVLNAEYKDITANGIFIVELFPDGIGLIEAFKDDVSLLLNLLEWTYRWLEDCPCQEDMGCARCILWEPGKATQRQGTLSRLEALRILKQVAPLEV